MKTSIKQIVTNLSPKCVNRLNFYVRTASVFQRLGCVMECPIAQMMKKIVVNLLKNAKKSHVHYMFHFYMIQIALKVTIAALLSNVHRKMHALHSNVQRMQTARSIKMARHVFVQKDSTLTIKKEHARYRLTNFKIEFNIRIDFLCSPPIEIFRMSMNV